MKIGNITLKINNKKRAYPILISMTVLFLLICFMIFPLTMVSGTEEIKYLQYTVKSDDTIWSIAQNYLPSNTDLRQFSYEITKINKKQNQYIYVGEILKIPVE